MKYCNRRREKSACLIVDSFLFKSVWLLKTVERWMLYTWNKVLASFWGRSECRSLGSKTVGREGCDAALWQRQSRWAKCRFPATTVRKLQQTRYLDASKGLLIVKKFPLIWSFFTYRSIKYLTKSSFRDLIAVRIFYSNFDDTMDKKTVRHLVQVDATLI